MTAAIFVGLAFLVLAGFHWRALRQHDRERDAWAHERVQLVNRAIARHSGEVLALDRQQDRPTEPKETQPRVLVEGLS